MDQTSKKPLPQELKWIEEVSRWMDDRFRIPGTNIRFGLDPILGLVPIAGEAIGFVISAMLVLSMIKQGVSGEAALRMLGNVLLDFVVGQIPILGDIFDVGFKANTRNLALLKAHYTEGKYTGSGKYLLLTVVLLLVFLLSFLVYLSFVMFTWLLSMLQ